MAKAPALFVGHGSPFTALSQNRFTAAWTAIGRRIPRPEAVLCVSAHWETPRLTVTADERPPTVHDFYGFPKQFYELRYPAPGSPALAAEIAGRLAAWDATAEAGVWGMDHGCWTVLPWILGVADVPVMQLSLNIERPPAEHYAIGQALAGLREEGVMILGSGDIVHNLRFFERQDDAPTPPWAAAFDAAAVERIKARDHAALIDWPSLPDAALAVPRPEHYLPLLYILAAQGEDEEAEVFVEAVVSSVSMTSVAIGLDAP